MKPPKILIELKPSKIHGNGVGVFAVGSFKIGEKIAEGISKHYYRTNLVPWSKFKSFNKETKKKVMDFCIGTPKGFVPPENLDFNYLSTEWYFNHSCEGNLGFDKNGDFIAIRNIKKGEELSYDYGIAESNPSFRMKCNCHSKKCRKIITGNDWKILILSEIKKQYMFPYLGI